MQIFKSTSEGVFPAVNDCQGASQNDFTLFTVGKGVISEKLAVAACVGVGVSSVKSYSLEKVISWSHSETVILEAIAVSVVAQMVVSVAT